MARKPRVHYPTALYHVIMRGNARQDIFFDNEDRIRFYLLLQEGTEKYGHRIHAFCLMTNHVHLAIQGNLWGNLWGQACNIGISMIETEHGTKT